MIIFGMIGDLDHAFCSPYISCTRSQRVAALVSQIQIAVRRASLSNFSLPQDFLGAILSAFKSGWCQIVLVLYCLDAKMFWCHIVWF